MRVVSWNLNVRRDCQRQVAAVASHNPDIVAFQEVTERTAPRLQDGLKLLGLESFLAASDLFAPNYQPRMSRMVAVASRWPIEPSAPAPVPVPEVVLPVRVLTPHGPLDLVNVHLPNATREPPLKVETQEGIFKRMAQASLTPHLLCGDFNSPKSEMPDGTVIPFASRRSQRALKAEMSLVKGLTEFAMVDAYRELNGYDGPRVETWTWHRNGKSGGYRLDYLFVSRHFTLISCSYDHQARLDGLSDHSLLVADLRFRNP